METYGGGLWHTWLDRDLGIAGKVILRTGENTFTQRLVHINRPLLRVPSLCIHLQTADERSALKINPEDHLTCVLGLTVEQLNKSKPSEEKKEEKKEGEIAAAAITNNSKLLDQRHPPELLMALGRELGVDPVNIMDFDLTLADTQRAQIGGVNEEFLFSPRLDNQMHCFTSIEALMSYTKSGSLSSDSSISMVCLFDHEEVGSESSGGAGAPVLKDAVERINQVFDVSSELHKISLDQSLLISADGSHAIHPNYQGKHEMNHQPKMNAGTVIKTNANQRYATTNLTGFIVRELARQAKVSIQEFVVRQDSPCGSTIGPIISANTGIRTVDVGIPQLSMHSIRETCGVYDLQSNSILLTQFFLKAIEIDQAMSRPEDHDGLPTASDVSIV